MVTSIFSFTDCVFSLPVFRENPRYCYSLGSSVISMQKLTFCNISLTTEDIYLKLRVCLHYPKRNPYYQGRQFKMHFFLHNYAPFSTKTFYLLSSTPQLGVGTCVRCSCFVCFLCYQKQVSSSGPNLICRLQMLSVWMWAYFLLSGKDIDRSSYMQ